MDKKFFSTSEVAKMLNISRIAVFKKIKSGDIKAMKIGRNFAVARKDLPEVLGAVLRESQRLDIEKAVKKTIKEYGETLKLLGQE